jgi:hypothetical protein
VLGKNHLGPEILDRPFWVVVPYFKCDKGFLNQAFEDAVALY